MSINISEAMQVLLFQHYMSFFLTDPVFLYSKAIRDMRPIIDPEEDYLTIVAAEESIAASHAKRKKQLEEAHANLKGTRRSA